MILFIIRHMSQPDICTAGSLPLVQQSKPAGEKRRICATPMSVAPSAFQQRSAPAISAEAQSDVQQPSQPPAPRAEIAAPADAPAMQEPDEAQKSPDVAQKSSDVQPNAAAVPDLAPQEPQSSARQREVSSDGGPACFVSGAHMSEARLPEGRPQANTAEDASAVQESGEELSHLLSAHGLLLHLQSM